MINIQEAVAQSFDRVGQRCSATDPGMSRAGSARHGAAAYPNPVVANDHDSPDCQIFGDLVQVGQDDG